MRTAMLLSVAGTSVAAILILAGLIVLPLPIPLGAIMILIGVGLAVSVNKQVRVRVMRLRAQHPQLELAINRFKGFLPGFLRKPIADSAPEPVTPTQPAQQRAESGENL